MAKTTKKKTSTRRGKTKPDLESLLRSIVTTAGEARVKCWYQRVTDPELKTLVDSVQRIKDAGKYISMVHLLRIMKEHFNFDIGNNVVRNHLMHRCSCDGRKK